MKINGTNQTNVNPYHKQAQANQKITEQIKKQKPDQLEISDQALKLQQSSTRKAYVNEIKQQIDNGQYVTNSQETAKKILNFWKV
ncbi:MULTISPECIES: flagellar biosynthesis anti-sigma factor FlgM [Gracilibacillus]|uniref:flagellar biosynthesis anti-sigma factor FlgM n=1 Tax=Gracilibacillus TaxID=74385 RepID=UPI000824676A|nr:MULTISPECIES: flagellar biosynthesis anti-sigma factor FlgM [Gracilibacillus]